ncbi:MAG: hypothetical protein ABIQ11_03640, partial [Saprospiraceae bacterium]
TKMKLKASIIQRYTGILFVVIAFLFFTLNSCKEKSTASETTKEAIAKSDTLPADFLAFYDKFHADSAYQMEHINFPLEGLPSAEGDIDSIVDQRYFWQREEWKKHNHFTDPSGQFEQWFEILNPRVIEHWVQVRGTKLVIRRRFANLDDGWYLIYYAGLRPLER